MHFPCMRGFALISSRAERGVADLGHDVIKRGFRLGEDETPGLYTFSYLGAINLSLIIFESDIEMAPDYWKGGK